MAAITLERLIAAMLLLAPVCGILVLIAPRLLLLLLLLLLLRLAAPATTTLCVTFLI